MQSIRLKPGHDRRIRAGHAWVFSNEIADDVRALQPGGVVDLLDASGAFLGRGTGNPASLISVRLLSRDRRDDLDSVDFYADRIKGAAALRARLLPDRDSCRIVCGEADFLPGLVVDRYDGVLAVQLLTVGMESRRALLAEALQRALAPRGAVLRNEASVRLLEGLPQEAGPWFGEVPERVAFDAGLLPGGARLRLWADVSGGQKTGAFFDQAENRAFAARVVAGARVLDVYANTGGWAVAALVAGAASAEAVEVNPRTCEIIAANAALNGVQDRLTVTAADARARLGALAAAGARFDAVFLDPPAFAKTKKKAGVALHAYKDVNRLAMEVLAPGGLLFTSSCSYHILEERFLEAVTRAAAGARRALRQVRRGEQSPDHPVIPAMPETRYLKHLVFQVL